jgi:hypothetical protein
MPQKYNNTTQKKIKIEPSDGSNVVLHKMSELTFKQKCDMPERYITAIGTPDEWEEMSQIHKNILKQKYPTATKKEKKQIEDAMMVIMYRLQIYERD